MGGIARGLITALIWIVIGFGPFLLLAGLLVWLVLRWRRSRRKPKEETKAQATGTTPG
jgi:membrane protein implicated in regulation of membrane protease activity